MPGGLSCRGPCIKGLLIDRRLAQPPLQQHRNLSIWKLFIIALAKLPSDVIEARAPNLATEASDLDYRMIPLLFSICVNLRHLRIENCLVFYDFGL
jgi:hypothetical protein